MATLANEPVTGLRERFLNTYSNLPIGLRKEVILVIDKVGLIDKVGPITWDVAYIEVESNTELGTEILKKLERLDII